MPNILVAQTDFSAGQVNKEARRRDEQAMVRAGAEIMLNWRCTPARQLQPRPGRRPQFRCQGGRTQRFRMATSVEVLISFSAGAVAITDLFGNPAVMAGGGSAQLVAPATYLWTDTTLNQIYVTQALNDIVVTYPGMRPQILRWDRASNTWTFGQFTFATAGNQSYEPFYRFSVPGASMSYTASSGSSVTLTCSVAYFTAAMVGARLSIAGQQCTIVAYTSPTSVQVSIGYRLPDAISVPVNDTTPFTPGQIVANSGTPGYKFEVGSVSVATGAGTVSGVLISSVVYPSAALPGSGDTLVSPIGSSTTTGAPSKAALPRPTLRWSEEFMSALAGWPAASFYDNGRLGFCDFPQLAESILWSSTNATSTFWIDSEAARLQPEAGAAADSAMLEQITGRPRVRHVVGLGDEFVFTDRGIFQIPISTSTPLQPGNVDFRKFSTDGVAGIPPVPTQSSIVYVNAGLSRCSAVRATGSLTQPYVSEDLSDFHSDLFNGPVAMAITSGDGAYPERLVYLVMADQTLVVGRFTDDEKFVGWQPWTSANQVTWVTAAGSALFYTSAYQTAYFLEAEDDTTPLDAAIAINTPPANLAVTGLGPLWPLSGRTVTLLDGLFDRGDRSVDTQGNLIGQGGEDLSSPTLTAGLYTPAWLRPFTPAGEQGNDAGQRQHRRRILRAMATVQNHSGFQLGTRAFSSNNYGDDPTNPTLKSGSYWVRPLGRSYDPVVDLVKDRPGPATICEMSMEATP